MRYGISKKLPLSILSTTYNTFFIEQEDIDWLDWVVTAVPVALTIETV